MSPIQSPQVTEPHSDDNDHDAIRTGRGESTLRPNYIRGHIETTSATPERSSEPQKEQDSGSDRDDQYARSNRGDHRDRGAHDNYIDSNDHSAPLKSRTETAREVDAKLRAHISEPNTIPLGGSRANLRVGNTPLTESHVLAQFTSMTPKQPVIMGEIQNEKVPCFLDSGASFSAITAEAAMKLKLSIIRAAIPISYVLADFSSMRHVHSMVKPTLKFGTYYCETPLYVVGQQLYPITLGFEWQERHLKEIRWSALVVSLADNSLYPIAAGNGNSVRSAASVFTTQPRLTEVLADFAHIFAQSTSGTSVTNLITHRIETGDHPPLVAPIRRYSHYESAVMEAEVKKMLKSDIVRPSTSSWCFAPLLVPKVSGEFRFCIDFRPINNITTRDHFPLPRIDDLLNQLKDACFFSTLDLVNGYWQIPIDEDHKQKTAFRTPFGQFEFNVMPFGLMNAPSTFQRLMNIVLKDYLGRSCLVYLDDIIIYSASSDEHIDHIRQILDCLSIANLRLKASKCTFLKTSIDFLGFTVSANGLAPQIRKIDAILDMPIPSSKRELQRFLGLCNFYRQFVPRFAELSAPLYERIGSSTAFIWGQKEQAAMNHLKAGLTDPLILAFPDFSQPFDLHSDASLIGIGAVLSQNGRPIAFASCRFTDTQKRYAATDREFLGVVWAVEFFRPYILGGHTRVYTDHRPIVDILKTTDPHYRRARWLMILQSYDLSFHYMPGKLLPHADALSRAPLRRSAQVSSPQSFECESASDVHTMAASATITVPNSGPITIDQLRALQESDLWCRNVKEYLRTSPLSRATQYAVKHYSVVDDVLVHRADKWPCDQTSGLQFVIPESLRTTILAAFHDSPTAGHLGIKKTYQRLRQYFYWPRFRPSIAYYVRKCSSCQESKGILGRPAGVFVPIEVSRPFELISLDIMGPLPTTPRGNRYIICAIDYLTRWPVTKALEVQSAESVSRFLLEDVILQYGAPERILTDNGANFTSNLLKQICETHNVRHTLAPPYNPSTNGAVERFNRTMKQMLRCYLKDQLTTWDLYLPALTWAYRTAMQSSLNDTPFRLLFGRKPPQTVIQPLGGPAISRNEWAQSLPKQMEVLRNTALRYRRQAIQTQRRHYNERHRQVVYEVGDRVWLFGHAQSGKTHPTLSPRWVGPCRILERLGRVTYRVGRESRSRSGRTTQKKTVVHVSRLKRVEEGEETATN